MDAKDARWALNRAAVRLPGALRTRVGWVLERADAGRAAALVPHLEPDGADDRGAGDGDHGAAGARLLIGPRNTAGQGHRWAQAAQRWLPGVQARSLTAARPRAGAGFAHETDILVPPWLQDFGAPAIARRVAEEFTHVLLESGRSVLGGFHSPVRGTSEYSARGLTAAIVLHGSEIRDPARHAEQYPASPFAEPDPEWDVLAGIAAGTRRMLAAAGVPVFVSTPDLLDFAPRATWLPVSVDADHLERVAADAPPPLGRSRPVVVHAPSNARLKGTAVVDPVLRALDAAGRIVYRRLDGVPHAQMSGAIASADVVVDQIALGSFGVLAAEAMASRRLVVAHVADHVRQRYADAGPLGAPAAGPSAEDSESGQVTSQGRIASQDQVVPIVEAMPSTFADVMETILADPEHHAGLAESGPAFVRRFHDGRAAAAALAGFLGVTPPT